MCVDKDSWLPPFQDRNDVTPEFELSSYEVSDIMETVSPGTPVVEVKATDDDPPVRIAKLSQQLSDNVNIC